MMDIITGRAPPPARLRSQIGPLSRLRSHLKSRVQASKKSEAGFSASHQISFNTRGEKDAGDAAVTGDGRVDAGPVQAGDAPCVAAVWWRSRGRWRSCDKSSPFHVVPGEFPTYCTRQLAPGVRRQARPPVSRWVGGGARHAYSPPPRHWAGACCADPAYGLAPSLSDPSALPPLPQWLAGSSGSANEDDGDAGPAVEAFEGHSPDGGGACPPAVAVVTAALCRGCGSGLHSDDPDRLGYIPAEKLELILLMDRRRSANLPATAAAASPHDPGGALEREWLVRSAAGPEQYRYDDGSGFLLDGVADDSGSGGASGSSGGGKGAAPKSMTCARCHDLTFHRGRKTPMLPSDQVESPIPLPAIPPS